MEIGRFGDPDVDRHIVRNRYVRSQLGLLLQSPHNRVSTARSEYLFAMPFS
jgi:hypothetical protein